MRKVAFACLLFLASFPGFAANLAISAFRVSGRGVTAEHESLIIDLLTSALSREKGITLVERRNLDKVLKEIEISLGDLIDSNTALRAGKIMGAAYILTGSLLGLPDGFFLSLQVIDNTTGAVILALDKEVSTLDGSALKGFVGESVKRIVRRLAAPGTEDVDLLWITRSPGRLAKPILIYIMSTVADSQDPSGQWYYGPQHLAPVTDALRERGFSVEIHDRRSLANLAAADLTAYSQVWLLEGDGNNVVNPTAGDVTALYNFYLNGGGVWLSGENILSETDADWVEDVNAFADVFGVKIDQVVISKEPWLSVSGAGAHPLLGGVRKLVFDNEVGRLLVTGKSVLPLVTLDPGSRLLAAGGSVDALFKLADPERVKEVRNGKKDWSLVWLLGKNAALIGPEIGEGAAAVAVADERATRKGRLIVDAGWLLGWAFNGDRGEIATTGDDLVFVVNAAAGGMIPGGRLARRGGESLLRLPINRYLTIHENDNPLYR